MKTVNYFLLYALIFVCSVSCTGNARNNLSSTRKVVDITCDSCVLFIRPTVEQIETIKSNYQNEEQFYIMADDANSYTVDAIEYLESKNIDVFYLDSIKYVCFNRKDTLDFSNLAWDFVLYKKNKTPKVVPAIDLTYEFNNWFDINKSANLSETKSEWDTATEVGVISDNMDHLNMTRWSNDCNSNYSVYFDVSGAQFSFSTNYTMNTILKKRDATTFAVYFSYPIARPIPENMQDCQNYAGNIPVAKIEQINDKLEFTWLGFYNTEKGMRVHTQNPFNMNQPSVVLEKCDHKN